MKPIIGRIGGKSRWREEIVQEHFPKGYENMVYVEPFVGGGSIYFHKNPSVKEVINDIDSQVIEIYKGFKKFPTERIFKDAWGTYTKDDFVRILNSHPTGEYQKLLRLFILYRISYLGKLKTFIRSIPYSVHPRYLYNYQDRLKHTIIKNTDYKDIIKKYDSYNTFFYLDPPYEVSTTEYYGNPDVDYEEMASILLGLKGRFLLSINSSPNIREIFKDFNQKLVYPRHSSGGAWKKRDELLISNY